MATYFNKSSQYISSLVDYIVDTKPYHSKLTEVVEEYQFADTVNVKIAETSFVRSKHKATWLYNFFSGGSVVSNTFTAGRVLCPEIKQYRFQLPLAGTGADETRDDNIDMTGVPLVFSKKQFDGIGVADSWIEKNGTLVLPYVEGIDIFQSHGSLEFKVNQTYDISSTLNQQWVETRLETVISTSSAHVGTSEQNLSRPASAINALITFVQQLSAHLSAYPAAAPAVASCTSLLATLNTGVIPPAFTTSPGNPDLVITGPYETIINEAIAASAPPPPGFAGWIGEDGVPNIGPVPPRSLYVDEHFSHLIPPLLFNSPGDTAARESGRLQYAPVSSNSMRVFNIIADDQAPSYQEFTLTAVSVAPAIWAVSGSVVGFMGTVELGSTFVHPNVSFNTAQAVRFNDALTATLEVSNISSTFNESFTVTCIDPGNPAVGGTWTVSGSVSGPLGTFVGGGGFQSPTVSFVTDINGTPSFGETTTIVPVIPATVVAESLTVSPSSRFVIHKDAAVGEVWNIIKVNPLAYTRPVFASTRYGHIENAAGTVGTVSIVSHAIADGTLVLTALNSTTFSFYNTGDPLHTGVATVGTLFTDTLVSFRIVAGTISFVAGDTFLINIVNEPASALDFDLYYGYDLDSYDNPDLVYNNTNLGDPDYNRTLDFRYDSRFTDYDLATTNLQITQAAIDGRSFRAVAVPNLAAPIATLKRDGTTISNSVDLTAEDDEIAPVVVTGVPVFSMPGDPNPADDIQLYYADGFRIEYSDDNFNTVTVVTTVPVGGSFSDPVLGVSFDLPTGSKPFIAASCDNGLLVPRLEGGDMFSFKVSNPPPLVEPVPVGLTGARVPRLIMHGDSHYYSVPADWTVTFTNSNAYTVSARYSTGPQSGTIIPGYPVSGTRNLASASVNVGNSYRDEIAFTHFTIVPGRGLGAGDTFTFTAFENKPSFLVHGSVSGWQPDAEYGKWYWNGKIGFKIKPAGHQVWRMAGGGIEPAEEVGGFYDFTVTTPAHVKVNSVRPDAPFIRYNFTRAGTGWQVTRSDIGPCAWTEADSTFSDAYISVEIFNLDPAETFFEVITTPDNYDFWNAQDTVVVRSPIDALNATETDFVVVKKTEDGTVGVNLDYTSVISAPNPLSNLGVVAITQDYIDSSTGGSTPLSSTSPETALLNGWLPTFTKKYDTANSIAEFSDVADVFKIYSTYTGQEIGTLKPSGASLSEPTIFEWEPTFFTDYLPLNASANLVTYGTGLDDNVRVHMTEHVMFLTSGSALFENALFNDDISVTIEEGDLQWNIVTAIEESMAATVSDGPFGGYLAGYDNLPYDAEDALGLDIPSLTSANGQYDTGQPLVDHFLRAQYLATLVTPSPAEQTELSTLVALVGDYLQVGGLAATGLPDFLAALDLDPYAFGGIDPGFGVPSAGHSIDIGGKSVDVGAASINEALAIIASDAGAPFDANAFDVPPFDAVGVKIAFMFSSDLPPVPVTVAGSYGAQETPFEVVGQEVSVFQIQFANPPPAMPVPNFRIWRPTDPSHQPVGVVQVITNGVFRFSVPNPTEAKILAL